MPERPHTHTNVRRSVWCTCLRFLLSIKKEKLSQLSLRSTEHRKQTLHQLECTNRPSKLLSFMNVLDCIIKCRLHNTTHELLSKSSTKEAWEHTQEVHHSEQDVRGQDRTSIHQRLHQWVQGRFLLNDVSTKKKSF